MSKSYATNEPNATEPLNAANHADTQRNTAAAATEHQPYVHGNSNPVNDGSTRLQIRPIVDDWSTIPREAPITDIEMLRDVLGNKRITLPRRWPLARPQLAERRHRLARIELRLGYAWAIQTMQHDEEVPVLPPCSWCGQPTGGYCDFCTSQPYANPVCSACGGTDGNVMAYCRRYTR